MGTEVTQGGHDLLNCFLGTRVLPEPKNTPACFAEPLVGVLVPPFVGIKLLCPTVRIPLGTCGVLRAAVPEAAVHETASLSLVKTMSALLRQPWMGG